MPSLNLLRQAAHFFSQFVYLDLYPGAMAGKTTVLQIANFYSQNPVGKELLKKRFGNIPKEYADWQQFLKLDKSIYKDWVIDDILDDNAKTQSGFYACCFVGPFGERVVAFRGSENLGNIKNKNDYENDFSLSYLEVTPQHKVTEEYWKKFSKKYILNVEGCALCGHSLGGNLAVYAAMVAPLEVLSSMHGCFSFNAPGFNSELIKKSQAFFNKYADKIFLYQNEYDPVSSLLYNPVKPILVASKFIPKDNSAEHVIDLFYPHSNFLFKTDSSGEFVAAKSNQKSKFCQEVNKISDVFIHLPVAIKKDLCNIILDAIYSNKENAIEQIVDNFKLYFSKIPFVKELGENKIVGSVLKILKQGEWLDIINALSTALPIKDISNISSSNAIILMLKMFVAIAGN